MPIINIDKILVDGSIAKSIVDAAKKFFAQQPKWLCTLLILAVISWCSYYVYNYFSDQKSINELQNEISVIEEKMNNILSIEMYQENLIYVITELQLLQQDEEQNYKENMLEIELYLKFLKRHYPGDPTIRDLEAMHERAETNHESYMQHYRHVMHKLRERANDVD
ncbi:MAG: hypothetical protein [Wendovervirus sonii]|uniref:Uncharacterized protein n=1 Tax=phage Lak_Megaphage_Sonny TaxID=3109229 RepID=A0ABZ0Z747_9CAUD|nr:MAG: hypothetical protein [phage Lak_Megaphage_Sonny]